MQANDEPSTDFHSEFKRLADVFDGIAKRVREPKDGPEEQGVSVWQPIDLRNKLLEEKSHADQAADYRGAVASGGSLCVKAFFADLLQEVDSLTELIAAMELEKWGDLVHNHSNLFALLVGGPRIELQYADGSLSLMEKQNEGWPIQFKPSPSRGPTDIVCRISGGVLEPDSKQCERYANFCRKLARKCPQLTSTGTMPRRVAEANELYEMVVRDANKKTLTDDAAYTVLEKSYKIEAIQMQKQFGKLPRCATWKRYLREYRKRTHNQKNLRRVGEVSESRTITHRDKL